MSQFDDFLEGKPLTPELALLRAGEDRGQVSPPPAAGKEMDFASPDRELTDAERLDLRQMYHHPGWRVMQRLQQRTLRAREKTVMILSQEDPLGNRDKIAESWAYLAIWKEQCLAHDVMIQNELAVLRSHELDELKRQEGNNSASILA
jgi:hypothetical protein